jgi:hypothetical protein
MVLSSEDNVLGQRRCLACLCLCLCLLLLLRTAAELRREHR